MKNNRRYRFEVEGAGGFPFDMLRYDECWPMTSNDSALLEHHERTRRRVVMNGNIEPTPKRWDSFNWKIISSEEIR